MERVVGTSVEIRILGPVAVIRDGAGVAMPRSRKVRALLAYLALSPRPVSRARLCDLLWDVPNDPRGELRWCLSELRGLLDEDQRRRIVTNEDLVALDLSDCLVDAIAVERAMPTLARTPAAELERLSELFAGDLLDGLDVDGSPEFTGWLSAQRNRFRGMQVELLQALASRAKDADETLRWIDRWLQVSPFDLRAHELML